MVTQEPWGPASGAAPAPQVGPGGGRVRDGGCSPGVGAPQAAVVLLPSSVLELRGQCGEGGAPQRLRSPQQDGGCDEETALPAAPGGSRRSVLLKKKYINKNK